MLLLLCVLVLVNGFGTAYIAGVSPMITFGVILTTSACFLIIAEYGNHLRRKEHKLLFNKMIDDKVFMDTLEEDAREALMSVYQNTKD